MKLTANLGKVLITLVYLPFFSAMGASFEVLTGDAEICDKVADRLNRSVQIGNITIPSDHEAGQDLKFSFTLEKKESLSEAEWMKKYSSVSINSIIEKPYSKFVRHQSTPSLIDFFFSTDVSKSFEVITKVRENIGGTSRLRLSLFLNAKIGACLIATKLEPITTFHSKNPDIIPPLIRRITYDKAAYHSGETATVQFQLTEPLDKPESDHIEFVNPEIPIGKPSRGIPKYGPVHLLKENGENVYEFSFVIPTDPIRGKYHLGYFNRQDKLENFEGRVGSEDALEKEVAEKAPLIVE